jgi:hypothetical protein
MVKKLFILSLFLLGLNVDAQIINFSGSGFKYRLTQANTSNTIAKNLAGDYFKVDANGNGEIEVSEALNVSVLNVDGYTAAVGNNLVGISYFTNLVSLDCHYNTIASLDLSNLVNLNELNCYSNMLTSLIISPSNHIVKLNCSGNRLPSLNTAILTYVTELNCAGNFISTITFGSLPNLVKLYIGNNPLTAPLNLSLLVNLTDLDASNTQIPIIDLSNLVHLQNLGFEGNAMTSIDLSHNPELKSLAVRGNLLTSIDLSNLTALEFLYLDNNNLTGLDVSHNPLLFDLWCQNNQITSLDVSNLSKLYYFYCAHNQLTSLDCGGCHSLNGLNVGYNQLFFLNVKNGSSEWLDVQSNPDLRYICNDEYDYNQYYLYNNGYNFNSYCNFMPGGEFYIVNGSQRIDLDNNGCDSSDTVIPNFNYSFTDGTTSGNYLADNNGNFIIPFHAGTQIITPVLENLSYFAVSPASISVAFPTEVSPYSQNFCITPNGLHQDIETWIIPLTVARPGFDARYKIIYKNKGTVTISGSLTYAFDDEYMDFVSAIPTENNQSFSLLSWNYTNLLPYETREIVVVLNINTPVETPAVNLGDVLKFSSVVFPITGDEYSSDNSNDLRQIVVGSFDPNDKICVEGDIIDSDMIGDYVHYVIRFENTGTFAAENIVVRDIIDLDKFDISTLVPLNSSHNFITKVNASVVEFIFENINLPFEDTNNDGYITFKIKTKPTLVVGDSFSNNASIYFDYNPPIVTNTFTSIFQELGIQDFEFSDYFSLFPNPTEDVLHIKSTTTVFINSVSIYNTLGQLIQVVTNPTNTIDISTLKSGNYFIRLTTDKGITSGRFVKR